MRTPEERGKSRSVLSWLHTGAMSETWPGVKGTEGRSACEALAEDLLPPLLPALDGGLPWFLWALGDAWVVLEREDLGGFEDRSESAWRLSRLDCLPVGAGDAGAGAAAGSRTSGGGGGGSGPALLRPLPISKRVCADAELASRGGEVR